MRSNARNAVSSRNAAPASSRSNSACSRFHHYFATGDRSVGGVPDGSFLVILSSDFFKGKTCFCERLGTPVGGRCMPVDPRHSPRHPLAPHACSLPLIQHLGYAVAWLGTGRAYRALQCVSGRVITPRVYAYRPPVGVACRALSCTSAVLCCLACMAGRTQCLQVVHGVGATLGLG